MKRTSVLEICRNRRSRIETAATILALAQNGQSQLRLMEAAGLHSRRLKKYLLELSKSGLLELGELNRKKVYITSPKGKRYLEECNDLMKLLK